MTKEEIEEAAQDYDFDGTSKSGYESFIAGAEFRQVEIDELVDILKRLLSHNYDYEAINIGNELLKKYEYERDNV